MPKIRRGGYVFLAWKGDHAPRRVHVYKEGEFVVKWDLERGEVMRGEAGRRLVRLIGELVAERRL